MNIGKLLGLETHYIEASESSTFEAGATRCGIQANRPPDGGKQGYSATSNAVLTTAWSSVTCMACVTKITMSELMRLYAGAEV